MYEMFELKHLNGIIQAFLRVNPDANITGRLGSKTDQLWDINEPLILPVCVCSHSL